MNGVLLKLLHPMIAARDCGHCAKYFYDDDPQSAQFGMPRRKHNGTDDLRLRDSSCPPPCRTQRGCPNGTPEEPRRLTEQNQQAYDHYKECQAVGVFPDDSIVKRNAAIIRDAEDIAAANKDAEFRHLLLKVAMLRG